MNEYMVQRIERSKKWVNDLVLLARNFVWLLGFLAVNAKSSSLGRDNTNQAPKKLLFLLSQ